MKLGSSASVCVAHAAVARRSLCGVVSPTPLTHSPHMPEADSFRIRRATVADATLLADQRVAMFRGMNRTTSETEPRLREACIRYLTEALGNGEYVSWIAEGVDGSPNPLGGAGVQMRPLFPRPDPSGRALLVGREGLILSVYVAPQYRRRGIARGLMETIIAWAPGAGIVRLVLHASDDGRALYEQLGFKASNEMLFPPILPSPRSSGGGV